MFPHGGTGAYSPLSSALHPRVPNSPPPPHHPQQANNKLEAAARGEAAAAKAAETARHTAEAASEELAKLKAASGGHARDLATAVAAKEEATKSLSAANAKVRVCAWHGVRLHSPSSPCHMLHPLGYCGRRCEVCMRMYVCVR